jgi:hypothetical protein
VTSQTFRSQMPTATNFQILRKTCIVGMNWGSSGVNRGTIGWGIAENGWPKWDPPILKIQRTPHNRHIGAFVMSKCIMSKFYTSCRDPAAVHCRFRFHTHCVQWAWDMGAWDRRHCGSCQRHRHAMSSFIFLYFSWRGHSRGQQLAPALHT